MKQSQATKDGIKMQLFRQLGRNTILHFDNAGKYGIDFEEVKIQYNGYSFRVIITDGYKDNIVGHVPSLKEAVSLGHLQLTRCK